MRKAVKFNKDILPINLPHFAQRAASMPSDHFGSYVLLAITYWRRGGLGLDRGSLKAICRIQDDRKFNEVFPSLRIDFEECDGGLRSPYFDWLRENAPNLNPNSNRPYDPNWRWIRALVFERDSFTCRYCGATGLPLDCDHVTPFSMGGTSTLENLVAACYRCNRSKGDKTLEEWTAGKMSTDKNTLPSIRYRSGESQ